MQIQNISNSISFIENDDIRNYMIYKSLQDKWNRDIYNIKNQIRNLEEETNKTAF